MSSNEIISIGTSILASLGGASLILFAFSSYLGKIWASRILESDRQKVAAQLETIKSDNQSFINALGLANSSYLETVKLFGCERMAAIKVIWEEVIKMRDERPSLIIWLDIAKYERYGSFKDNPKFDFARDDSVLKSLGEDINSAGDKVRPFLDDLSYAYFWSYRSLTSVLAQYMFLAATNGKPDRPWQMYDSVIDAISPVLSEETVNRIKTEMWDTTVLFNYLETEFANHLKSLASGRDDAERSLRNAMDLFQSASSLRKEQVENKDKS
jgi:hypothetical protein